MASEKGNFMHVVSPKPNQRPNRLAHRETSVFCRGEFIGGMDGFLIPNGDMDNGIIPWLENAGQAGERTMNPISEFIQANPLGAGGIAVGILAVLFFLKRFSRSDTVDMSDPGRAGRGDAKAQKKARGGWFAPWQSYRSCF
ncbi:MAG: hypothetical protein IIC13_16715 [SAR324 cluster bacterium]|nr:hypothetical protein [SAR324 cluster bacterium]